MLTVPTSRNTRGANIAFAFTLSMVSCGPEPQTASATQATQATSSTSDAGSSTSSSGTTSGSSSTGPSNLPPCGPPCAQGWEYGGDLTVGPGEDLSQYVCLTRVHGRFKAEGLTSEELGAFANLQRVEEDFSISGEEVTDLDAFACLAEVDSLRLGDMPLLTDASGLASLRSAWLVSVSRTGLTELPTFSPEFMGVETLGVNENPSIINLDAASSWPGLDGLSVRVTDNEALSDISGLAGPLGTTPGFFMVNVSILGLPSLTSLEGLSVPDNTWLVLDDLPLITGLEPLAGIDYISILQISGMPLVTSLAGLDTLGGAFVIEIGDCRSESVGMAGLSDLTGLSGLKMVGVLSLANNTSLVSLDGAGALSDVGGFAVVNSPMLPQQAVDAFLGPMERPPPQPCVGAWDTCSCAGWSIADIDGPGLRDEPDACYGWQPLDMNLSIGESSGIVRSGESASVGAYDVRLGLVERSVEDGEAGAGDGEACASYERASRLSRPNPVGAPQRTR